MKKGSFKYKIIVPAIIILVILVVSLNIFRTMKYNDFSNLLINERLTANINTLTNYLEESKQDSYIAAVTMTFNENAIQAIKDRDTQQLLEIFTPITDLYRINFFTICDDQGIVLARTHEPEHFGDSIAKQQNIKDALAGKTSTYYEEGTAVKVSARTGTPVYDEDRTLIGVISTGIRFEDDKEVEKLQKLFNAEVTVFLGDTRIATTIVKDGEKITGTRIDPVIGDIVLKNRQEYSGETDILGDSYWVFYVPLMNAQNIAFAMIGINISDEDIRTSLNIMNRDGIIFGMIGLAISIVALYLIISAFIKPLTKLSNDMTLIKDGSLNIDINTKGNDEIGILGKGLKGIADILYRLITNINMMISEQAKGNTAFLFDTAEFSGEYKNLAENILQLVTVSTSDMQTGLPTKRNFNSRLDWEWMNAGKKSGPISLLMIEIDDFDHYSKTYGQNQCDLALQALTKTIRLKIPSEGYAARWGAHRFSILLPEMDAGRAHAIAEELREAVGNTNISSFYKEGSKITVSIGVATQIPSQPGSEKSNLVSIADINLHNAIEQGKNRVVTVLDD